MLAGCGGAGQAQKQVALGKALLAKGDYDHASEAFRQAVHLDPKNGEAYYQLGIISWETGRPGLEANLRRAVDIQPRNVDALSKLGESLLRSCQNSSEPRARAAYIAELRDLGSRLLAIDANSYPGHRLKGYSEFYSSDFQGAAKSFESALRADPNASSAPSLAGDLVRAWIAQNRIDQAEAFGSEYISKHPNAKFVYEALSSYYETHSQAKRALELLEQRARANPNDPDPQLSLAALYWRLKRPDDSHRVLGTVLRDGSRFTRGAQLVGDACARSRDWQMATQAYREAAARNPAIAVAMRLKEAEMLRKQHRFEAALQVLQSLDAKASAMPETVLWKDTLLADLGFPNGPDAVIRELTSVRDRLPQDGRVAVQLGRAYQAKGDMSHAREQLRTAQFLLQNSAEAAIALARWNAAQNNDAQMRDAAMLAVQLDPDDVDAKLVRGMAAVETGEIGEAHRNLDEVLDALPGEPEAEYYVARLNLREGKQKEAEAGFRRLADQGDTKATIALADLYTHQQQYPLANQVLRDALSRKPSEELKRAYAHVAVTGRAFDEAIPLLRELEAKSPGDASVRLDLIKAYRGKGDPAAAFSEARNAEKSGMKDSALLMQLAELYFEVEHNRLEARRVYALIHQAEPDNALAGARLASLMLETDGDPLQAQGIAEQAMRVSPTNPEVAGSLASVYARRGLREQAISIYKGLIEKYPGDVKLRMGYAEALLQQGQLGEARQELEAALRTNPPSDKAAMIRARLARF